MKALTIRQPWATLIVMGIKNIENRSWKTNYRGELLIHAGKAKDPYAMQAGERLCRKYGLPFPEELPLGCYVGLVTLSGLVNMENRQVQSDITDLDMNNLRGYIYEDFGFVLTNPRSMPTIPANGRLGLFNPEEEILAQVRQYFEENRIYPSNPVITIPEIKTEKKRTMFRMGPKKTTP
jgi:hypothetical protein